MDEQNNGNSIKQKIIGGTKKAVKKVEKIIIKILKPILIKVAIYGGILILIIALLIWIVEESLFDVGSSSSTIFNSGGSTYTDPETEESIQLVGINEDETMWVIPEEIVDYIREQIMERSDIVRLNLAEEISNYNNLSPEDKEKLNKYIREFLKAEQATYYPNLEY